MSPRFQGGMETSPPCPALPGPGCVPADCVTGAAGRGVEGMGQNEEMGIMCGDFIVFSFVLVGETCYNSIRRVCRLNRNSLCYMV